MILLGLTGSIGMGKSTTAAMFAARGCPVHSADETVHRLYAGRRRPLVEARFPGTAPGGTVDRIRLSSAVLNDAAALRDLEAIVTPWCARKKRASWRRRGHRAHPSLSSTFPSCSKRAARRGWTGSWW